MRNKWIEIKYVIPSRRFIAATGNLIKSVTMIEGRVNLIEGEEYGQMTNFAFNLLVLLRDKKRDGVAGCLNDAVQELQKLGYVNGDAEITQKGIDVTRNKKFIKGK